MSGQDAATFVQGLGLGMLACSVTILAVCGIAALIFYAQERLARRSLPRERQGLTRDHPTSGAGLSSPQDPPVWEAGGSTPSLLMVESDVPQGVTLREWRAQRARERRAS